MSLGGPGSELPKQDPIEEYQYTKALDCTEYRQSSTSFFKVEDPETAISHWSRARTNAAKVGKGSYNNEKAHKLALQHWLEAILNIFMAITFVSIMPSGSVVRVSSLSSIGEGRQRNLEECPRLKLQEQCIKYLDATERKAFEIEAQDRKFAYKQSGKLVETREPEDVKWIFVLGTSKTLYIGQKNEDRFQHSKFLAAWPHGGHYRQKLMSFLKKHKIDVSIVKESPSEGTWCPLED